MRVGLPPVLCCLLALLFSFASLSSAAASGAIWAVKVEGTAWLEAAAKTRLAQGSKVPVGSTITTEANGNVVLLFENGSTINVRPGTKFSITDFSCDPFDSSKIDYRSLKAEPGKSSSTEVRVDDGSIIANVRKLNKGSSFKIGTPLGTAGIRGTTVVTEVDMNNADTPVTFGVADGSAVFAASSGQTQTVNGGSVVGISTQGQFAPPPANAGELLSTAQQIGQTMTQVVPPPTTTDTGAGTGTQTGTQSQTETATASTGASAAAGGPVALASQGTVTVVKGGAQSKGEENLNILLEPGTIITTGENGTMTIEVAPGIVIELQPNTQITIGQLIPNRGVNPDGDPVPQISIQLSVGSILVRSTAEGLAGTSFVIETARGNVNSVTAGSMVVTSTGADPSTATVTVAAVAGDKLAVTTEGEQLPVGEGLVVILRPDGIEYEGIQDYPELAGIAGVNPPIALPPAALPPPNPPSPSPTPTPTPTPTPSPSPLSP